MGPSQVVATRRSVERASMYSSISGVTLRERGLAGMIRRMSQDIEVGCWKKSEKLYQLVVQNGNYLEGAQRPKN